MIQNSSPPYLYRFIDFGLITSKILLTISFNISSVSPEFDIKITHEMEILPIIKYWIPYLKVLEPKWLDDIIKQDLKEYLKED